ncbi:unnamed protein product, partial [Ilex paraguariensis]
MKTGCLGHYLRRRPRLPKLGATERKALGASLVVDRGRTIIREGEVEGCISERHLRPLVGDRVAHGSLRRTGAPGCWARAGEHGGGPARQSAWPSKRAGDTGDCW